MSPACTIMVDKAALVQRAIDVKANAYCPMSQFPVGASVQTEEGQIFAGVNVENASFPCGWCAECSAIAGAISSGASRIIGAAVASNKQDFLRPCGRCRQVLAEFASPTTPVYLVNKSGQVMETTIEELLPSADKLDELHKK